MSARFANTAPTAASALADLAALRAGTDVAEFRLAGLRRSLLAASATAPVTPGAFRAPAALLVRLLVAAAVLLLLI
ncbi:MAG TPA: hypothetical protein VMP03_01835 [Methylomirabilota bacterium]|nr:hypothetical protein [Methylomirabilota bacterium]